jgi:cell division protein FtsI (penicillin-binding protein 3)
MSEGPTVFQRRIVIGAGLCVLAFALVGMRLAHVTLLQPLDGSRPALAIAARADLTDRNGELLARDLPVKDLYARPQVFWDKDQAARDLARATGAGEGRLLRGFHNAKSPYVLVARQVTPDVEAKVMALGLPGLEFEQGAKRFYPDGRNTAQVLGVTDPDGGGVSGLELGLQDALRRAPGGKVATSLDMRVQFIVADELAKARAKFRANAAGAIVMDVTSGEVLALVSLPDFDPNLRKILEGDSTRNIMAQDVYELGSIFKIFTFAMALEDKTVRPDEVLPTPPGYKIGRFTIREAHRMPSAMAAKDILAQSSNVGTLQIALRSGGVRQREFLSSLGLLSPLKTNLPETSRPLFPTRQWATAETATVSYGHGISVSPLTFTAALATVVNGGRRILPTFARQPDGSDRRGEQVVSEATSLKMRELLRYVVTDGTGRNADAVGYDVGGKTGTAEVPGPNGRYIRNALRSSFAAVFPVHNPRYVVMVLMDQPKATKDTFGFATAGYTAAPQAGRIIQRIAPLLGVPNTAPPTRLAGGNT